MTTQTQDFEHTPAHLSETMIDQIEWLGHGSFVIQGSPLIYINPWRTGRANRKADIILVSHEHYEHCSLADIERLRDEHTVVIASEKAAREIEPCAVLRPWQSMTVGAACIKAVPAYSPQSTLHAPEAGGLGFIISVNMYDIYYAGDTGLIPEMASIRPDIAILPIDGNGTMTPSEAAQAAALMRPRWVIPSNWGSPSSRAGRIDAHILRRELGDQAQVALLAQTS